MSWICARAAAMSAASATGRTPAAAVSCGSRPRSWRASTSCSCGGARVADRQLEQEPVELRLGQRVGALVLDRVLRGDDDERVGQRVRLALDGDLALLHRLEQRGLRLRRRAVDLVGQQHVGEHRARAGTGTRRHRPPPPSRMSWPVTSEGMRSGVNWTRFKSRSRAAASVLTISVLATPGTPSSSTWPRASSAATRPDSVPSWPTTTLATSSRTTRMAARGSWPPVPRAPARRRTARRQAGWRGRRHRRGRRAGRARRQTWARTS